MRNKLFMWPANEMEHNLIGHNYIHYSYDYYDMITPVMINVTLLLVFA